MRALSVFFLLALLTICCVPREQVILKAVENVELIPGSGEDLMLKAEARFYNPNKARLKLKNIQIDVWVDGKQSARIDQRLNTLIKARSEFTIPLEVKVSLKEIGLMDALMGLLGGKKFEIHYVGNVKLAAHGIPVTVPVDHKKRVRLR